MANFPLEAQQILTHRFSQQCLMTIATSEHNIPYLRAVNSIYLDGCFYFITHAQSSKVKQMEHNPAVALCGNWFTGHGIAENKGNISKKENQKVYAMLKTAFENWISEGNVDETDKEAILMCIHLKTGTVYSNGIRYEIQL